MGLADSHAWEEIWSSGQRGPDVSAVNEIITGDQRAAAGAGKKSRKVSGDGVD
jgi:hypothetical protein